MFKAKLKLEYENWKIQYGHPVAISKVTSLKTNRLLSIYTSNVLLKLGLDIQSQTKVRVRKVKHPISVKINTLAHGHKKHAYQIWNWNSKANLSYTPETMLSTESRYKKSKLVARQPFWKWRCWKSISFFPYTKVMCQWSLDLIFRAKI